MKSTNQKSASEPPTYPVVEDLHLAQDISEEKEVSENDLIFQNEDATDEFAFMPETPSRDPPIFGHHDMFADGKELQPATDTVHSDDAHHKAMSEFQIALALWVEQSQISRSEYESLLEVLSLLSSSEIDTLPKKLDTLKLHLRKCLPLLPLHRRLVAVDPKSQQTMPDLEKRLGIGQDKPQETTQFWFDMPELIKAIIQAHSKECHMGMAEYVDTPSELWHSRAWGSSILAASGHYAYSAANRAILPGDFIRFDPRPLAGLDVEANRGRVIFYSQSSRYGFSGTSTKAK
ncbi:hypothetical protein VTN49DRAFT_7243 [Thermomyces lanuginosus]|uniref:uncharacterized protein n=1 Tax=Thermomyces lanuginosus TaxID=5541 RepID=UPI003742AE06